MAFGSRPGLLVRSRLPWPPATETGEINTCQQWPITVECEGSWVSIFVNSLKDDGLEWEHGMDMGETKDHSSQSCLFSIGIRTDSLILTRNYSGELNSFFF